MEKRALAALGLCLALGACGHPKREPVRLTTAAFLAEANRACREATTRGQRIARLRALRPPERVADLYSRWLTAENDALRTARSTAGSASKDELEPDVALAIAEGKIAGYARRLGATDCAKRTIGTMPP